MLKIAYGLIFFFLASCAGVNKESVFIPQNPPTTKLIRVGFLVPLSAQNRDLRALARSLSDAAQLALFDSGQTRLVLIPQDTKGTRQGAIDAMARAVERGADIILGPLLSSSVEAITPLAKAHNVPVVAFSSDERIVNDNIYLFGFSPREQVRRILFHAKRLGVRTVAAFLPRTAYGSLVRASLIETSEEFELNVRAIETYPPSIQAAQVPAARLADYNWRKKARDQEMRRLERVVARAQTELRLRGPKSRKVRFVRGRTTRSLQESTPPQVRLGQAKAQIQRLKKIDALGEVPYQAILFAEGGDLLRGLVQLLPSYDITSKQVFFLGTGLWDDPKLSLELPLNGARFAAAAIDNATILLSRLRAQYRRQPRRLATLGYDVIGLVRALASQSDPPFTYEQLTQPDGFAGIDGIFRFRKNLKNKQGKRLRGSVAQRGLAVIEIKRRHRDVVTPAPNSFDASYFKNLE